MADSNKIAEIMEKLGYELADNTDDLISAKNPVLIFNTCSIRQKAEDRVFGLNNKTEQLKIRNSKLKIILTGCMIHHSETELKKRLPFFDHFVDIKKIKSLEKILLSRRHQTSTKNSPKASVLIPISNGCDNFCTYCIVPLARGRELSRRVIDIVNDVKKAVSGDAPQERFHFSNHFTQEKLVAKEIWLLGQTVNSYKNDNVKFHDLLRIINDIDGDFWIRFTSPHPKYFSDDLIGAMAECEKFARYINLPVQSGNNAVLKRMGRLYTVGHYKKLIKKIRKVMPDIAISTDVIVGFPGETRKQFEDTKKLFREIKFDMAFISEYSPRPKTAAYKIFKDDVPHEEKERRKGELNEILKKTALENNQKLIGKTVKVLNGRTEGNKPIEIEGNYPKNKFVSAKIIKANIWRLKGKLS